MWKYSTIESITTTGSLITTGMETASSTQNVNITSNTITEDSLKLSSDNPSNTKGVIVAAVLSSVFGLILIATIFFVWWFRIRAKSSPNNALNVEIILTNPSEGLESIKNQTISVS